MSVEEWLRSIGLGQYVAVFRENEIDAEILPELNENDFEKRGVPMGHRKRLLKAIAHKDSPSRDFIIDMLFGGGCPLLLVPPEWKRAGEVKRVVVAWDASAAAARAVRDALPLIAKAASIEVLSVLGEKQIGAEPSASDVAGHLKLHCREVSVNTAHVLEGGVAATIYGRARQLDADLVVMGGYGHSRLREFILGGVTRDMLAHTDVPTLLSH